METTVKTHVYPGGEIQRVQILRPDSWEELEFLKLSYSPGALDCFADIYRNYLVPACPWLFGNMVLFRIPEDAAVPFSRDTKKYGAVADDLTAAAAAISSRVRIVRGKPRFADPEVEGFWRALEANDSIRIVSGKLPVTTAIPVGNLPGYLSQTHADAKMKVNASFFIMDRFDCATAYDHVGTPFGLMVRGGSVENPPLYGREALLVKKDGTVSVEAADVRFLELEIGGKCYRHGENARIYSRPGHPFTPRKAGKKLVIVGCRVAAVSEAPSVPVPASGFVLYPEGGCDVKPGDPVILRGMEDVRFGIQVGNSILRNGEKTLSFRSRFYNIRHLEPVPYPPSLYPMNFSKARAARIALGADKEGRPMLLWAEGAGKLRYVPGEDSTGASLLEMAELCADAGMVHAVNLDGGGSAQILVDNRRSLRISDRNKEDNSDAERPVPLALMIR